MRRPSPPLLLPGPTRIATLARGPAIALLAMLGIALAVLLLIDLPFVPAEAMTRIAFHDALAERLRHGGEDYYSAAAATLRGHELPLHPFTAFPLPATATIGALVPRSLLAAMLGMLTAGTMLAWAMRLGATPGGRMAASLLALIGAAGWMTTPALALVPATWAGLFVSLALALRRPNRWVEAVAIATAAALLHEAAALALAVMAVTAWHEGRRRESAGWLAGIAVAAAALAVHAVTAGGAAGPLDSVAPEYRGAGVMQALGSFAAFTGPAAMPAALPIAALLGWVAWRSPVAARVGGVVAAYLLLLVCLPADAAPVALIVAPVAWLGLLPAADAVRDAIVATLDRRRITVTRVVR